VSPINPPLFDQGSGSEYAPSDEEENSDEDCSHYLPPPPAENTPALAADDTAKAKKNCRSSRSRKRKPSRSPSLSPTSSEPSEAEEDSAEESEAEPRSGKSLLKVAALAPLGQLVIIFSKTRLRALVCCV
jgi:hypothetical protein